MGYRPKSPVKEEDLDTEKLGIIGGLAMNEVPCPFLSEERTCEVYGERPIMCRLTLFSDREVCRKDWENPLAFLWRNEIYPFIEDIKVRFLPVFRREMEKIRVGLGVPESWEKDIVFITDWLRFDPVKKVFYIREDGKRLVP
ncbi:MAG: YkgJ family cysteine cluster protein [Aquificota bacterium]|nr:YkgJ family cysteine cluster protein [Aquificota bacterium]